MVEAFMTNVAFIGFGIGVRCNVVVVQVTFGRELVSAFLTFVVFDSRMTFHVVQQTRFRAEFLLAEVAGEEPEVIVDLEVLLEMVALDEGLVALRTLVVAFLRVCALVTSVGSTKFDTIFWIFFV